MVVVKGIEYNYNVLDGKNLDMRIHFDGVDVGSLEMLAEVGQALIDLANSKPELYDRQIMSEANRREIVEQILHNNAMEGLYPSKEMMESLERWIKKETTIDEMIDDAKQRYAKSSAVEVKD